MTNTLHHQTKQPNPLPLILASASPRRRRLLTLMGLTISVEPSAVDESSIPAQSPLDFAKNAAREKCLDIARHHGEDALVLGADTVVCIDLEDGLVAPSSPGFRLFPEQRQVILGKPNSPDEAAQMLRLLANRTHQVITGVAISHDSDSVMVDAEISGVRFRPLNDHEIAEYISTGEPLDKAGAYGVQGLGARFIACVDGDLSNVIGLPLALTARLLRPFYGDLPLPSDEELKKEAYRL